MLSPANLGGRRAAMVLEPQATFPLARALHSERGASLGDVFSFVSGLYFRGKATYARAFARPPDGEAGQGALVITPGEGLVPLDELVDGARLRRWATIDVHEDHAPFTEPLVRDIAALELAYGATSRFVLLGSVATDKYVVPLGRVLGDHLFFPTEFLGRGDMSRGALMLKAAREGVELAYQPVETARRRAARTRL